MLCVDVLLLLLILGFKLCGTVKQCRRNSSLTWCASLPQASPSGSPPPDHYVLPAESPHSPHWPALQCSTTIPAHFSVCHSVHTLTDLESNTDVVAKMHPRCSGQIMEPMAVVGTVMQTGRYASALGPVPARSPPLTCTREPSSDTCQPLTRLLLVLL
jgi:hypothetical protein